MVDWAERFEQFHEERPEIYHWFKAYALGLIASGKRVSAQRFMHDLRWDTPAKADDDGRFKVNQNYGSPLARKFVGEFPQHRGSIEIRERQVSDVFYD